MSLIPNKKSTKLSRAIKEVQANQANGNAQPKNGKPEEDFEIIVPKKKAEELDRYLDGIPHGIAMNIVAFFQGCEKRKVKSKINVP